MQEELSPDAQKRLLFDFAEKNNMIVSSQYIFIESVSGRNADKRPMFQQMIGMAKSKDHPFDTILVWKYSRFARNQEESIVYKSLLKKNDVDVISVSEPLVDGPFGTLIERIIEWMDEYYSIRLSGEVTRGMTEKALRGGYQASPPLGYKIERAGEVPVIVSTEADIVKTIFNKYVNERLTPFQIARYLNALGLKTKLNRDFERRGIEYILQNPTYKGFIRWNRTENATNTIKDESEWIIEKGEHEPIISEDLFESAQERFKSEYKPSKKARPITDYKHWLSGLVKCSNCGRTLTASTRKGLKYAYFQCNGYTKGKCSVSHSVSDNKLTPVLLTTIEEVIRTGCFKYEVIHKVEKTDTTLLEQQLNRLTVKEERIKSAYINGIDTIEEYKHNKEILLKEKNDLLDQISNLKKTNITDYKKDMLKRIKNVYNIITNENVGPIEKNAAMKSIIQKIIYNKSEAMLDIYFYYK